MGILPMTFHGRDTRATLLQTFLVSHGWVERDTVIVERKCVNGVVVAPQEIQLVHCGVQIPDCEIRNRKSEIPGILLSRQKRIRHRTYEAKHLVPWFLNSVTDFFLTG